MTNTLPPNPLLDGLTLDRKAPPGVLIIFGASGDLTARKLMPAINHLAEHRQVPAAFAVVGVARTEWNDDEFRKHATSAVTSDNPAWDSLVSNFRYVQGEYDDAETFKKLEQVLDELDETKGTSGNRTYYLATIPSTFKMVIKGLGEQKLNKRKNPDEQIRIVIEKPFGRDLGTALDLDKAVHKVFDESQVYRIDHYLGKETVQNVLALRFANAIFEPIWNRNYVDHVQITVAESIGVEHRGGFYETAGALRDIVQNHVLQVLALTVMEPPATFEPNSIRDEKVKALRAVDILEPEDIAGNTVRAQYDHGWVDGDEVVGYREEEGVASDSHTETYVALKLNVDNWRWAGVPFYIRTGKRLPKRITEVALQFRDVPHLPFMAADGGDLGPNALVMRIQPDEGITLRFGAKVPGQAFNVRTVSMDFSYGASFIEETPEAYVRLLLDAMVGDPTLFIRSDEVQQAWHIVDPLLASWSENRVPLAHYQAATWGPHEADDMMSRDLRQWRNP
jgi:glucose-6-phosphate 1-dehydrogenase